MTTDLKSVARTIHSGNPSPHLKGEWSLLKLIIGRGIVKYSRKMRGLAIREVACSFTALSAILIYLY